MATVKIPVPFKKQHFDRKAAADQRLLCGVDEVGRACLAGPVVVGALALKPQGERSGKMPLIADSKAMTSLEREVAYTWLCRNSWFATAAITHRGIDATSIQVATLAAMRRAVLQLAASCPVLLSCVLVDAMPLKIPFLDAPAPENQADLFENPYGHVIRFNYGEEHSRAIAAASIVAKVTRDRLMAELEKSFPAYAFSRHKGYGTKLHQTNLQLAGQSIIHRVSFLKSYQNPVQLVIE